MARTKPYLATIRSFSDLAVSTSKGHHRHGRSKTLWRILHQSSTQLCDSARVGNGLLFQHVCVFYPRRYACLTFQTAQYTPCSTPHSLNHTYHHLFGSVWTHFDLYLQYGYGGFPYWEMLGLLPCACACLVNFRVPIFGTFIALYALYDSGSIIYGYVRVLGGRAKALVLGNDL